MKIQTIASIWLLPALGTLLAACVGAEPQGGSSRPDTDTDIPDDSQQADPQDDEDSDGSAIAESVLDDEGDGAAEAADYAYANCYSGNTCIANCWGHPWDWFDATFYWGSTCTQKAQSACNLKGAPGVYGVCKGSLY